MTRKVVKQKFEASSPPGAAPLLWDKKYDIIKVQVRPVMGR